MAYFCLIYRTTGLGKIIAAFQGRFGHTEILPVYAYANESAKRILVRGVKLSKGPLTILPGIVLHEKNGSHTHEATQILTGNANIHR